MYQTINRFKPKHSIKSNHLQAIVAILHTTDAHPFNALRLQVFRILTLGISGFDSQVAKNTIPEAGVAGLMRYVSLYQSLLKEKDRSFSQQLEQRFASAKAYLAANTGFDTFDRVQFTRQLANPLSESLLQAQMKLGFAPFTEPRPLRADAKHLFAAGAIDPDFYAPGAGAYATALKQDLGRQLFFDPVLSRNGTRSCGSCHQPGKAFADALKTNTALGSGLALKRNIPSLLNAAMKSSLFYDTRVA